MTTRYTKRGSVLILVLITLALMLILLIALLEGATHQAHDAQDNAIYAREKMLADSAVAMVIGQIDLATTQPGQAWISQPGLLRTYDAAHLRAPVACYKLYSSTQSAPIDDTSGTLKFLAADVPPDWNSATNKSVYTDLNAPQKTPGLFGKSIYPILDLTAMTGVQGVSSDNGTVAMPVAWLYQRQDGAFGPASIGSKTNPIVARVAFWTDDDSNKIDINTAGCGSGWNTPRVNSADDTLKSTTQPAAGEFSSYPGHPATTSLAVVFDALKPPLLLGLTPRYALGGSQFGAQPMTPGETVPPKTDRLYGSLDELRYGAGLNESGQREASLISASELDTARFVLTAHSVSPETTLLGQPRIAIWPVSDAPQDNTKTTVTDRAVVAAATVGTGTANARGYYFQRHNALSATDDLDAKVMPDNAKLFDEVITRGGIALPGYDTTTFKDKYPDAAWTQIALEMTDFIRGLNAVDPNPSIVPFAGADKNGNGRGFIVPLTKIYSSGATQTTLRGMGRCPTLSSLTLVLYVSGFGFDDGTSIDFESLPENQKDAVWKANFDPSSPTNRWTHVTSELVRAFVVPCMFQPGCAFPEVSDACDIQITGLDGISVSGPNSNDFVFVKTTTSHLLCDALKVALADRAWGDNEGPLAWRAAALDQMNGNASYAFAGTKAFSVKLSTRFKYDANSKKLTWPKPMPSLTFNGSTPLTVTIRDASKNVLQTLSLNLTPPSGSNSLAVSAPTTEGECDHKNGATPDDSRIDWATSSSTQVQPYYYMSLRNRLLATQRSRAVFIQAGDVARGIEANTDLRVIAGLATVPASMYAAHPSFYLNQRNAQGGSHAHNIRFADGTSACFAPGDSPTNQAPALTNLVKSAPYPATPSNLITATDWCDGITQVPYTQFVNAPCSVHTGTNFVTMMPVQNINGDWDTGPGFSPDGAQINLPDAGTMLDPEKAYFSLTDGQVGAPTQRTPNALVPSPAIFGSLPAGINPLAPDQSEPWRTLLFCPNPAGKATGVTHPGSATPPDYLLLDNFWMPVVEPYPISTCMATAGKINLNNQIAPFTWLHRRTAFYALLDDLRIPAIPLAQASAYKSSGAPITSIWNPVDKEATIAQIEDRFANGDAYLTEGEICSVPLVPQVKGFTVNATDVAGTKTALDSFWSGGLGTLTGDNLRELPYAQLYGRLTTRSNSYTVHVRVQVLKKLPTDPNQNVWNEGVDQVLGDWRGSYEIERYLDPAAQAPPPTSQATNPPLGPYKYRVVSSRRFSP